MDSPTTYDPPTLPTDVVYYIVDYLQESKPALAHCSLVARSWLVPSRRHLFRSMNIPGATNFSDFIGFLRRSSDACAFLQELTLSRDEGSSLLDSRFPTYLDAATVRVICGLATNLRSLRIANVRLTDSSHWLHPQVPLTTLSLDSLSISLDTSLTEEQFLVAFEIVCLFASLGTLELDMFMPRVDMDFISPNLISSVEAAIFPAVRNFIYKLPTSLCLVPLYCMMARSIAASRSLTSISFFAPAFGDMRIRVREFCVTIVHSARDTLRELEFHPGISAFRISAVSPESWENPDLSECLRLERLILPLECEHMPYASSELSWQIASHANTLRTYQLPSLKSIIFKVRVPYNQDTPRYLQLYTGYLRVWRAGWNELDLVLSCLPYAPEVTFDFVGPWCGVTQASDLEDCLHALLPRARDLQMVRVELSSSFPRWRY